MEYYIFVSNECNLNCTYCSILVDARKYQIPVEPSYTIQDFYKFMMKTQEKNSNQDAEIVFFGGEPTLNFSFIENLIEYIENKERSFNITYMLHTNGLLLDKISDYLLDRLNAILLSINYLKLPKSNLFSSYFSDIIQNIKFIKKKRPQVPIVGRFTITEETSVYNLVMQFHPFFDYIYWQIENCYSFKNYKQFYETYTNEIKLLIDIWIKYLSEGIVLDLIPFISSVCFFIKNEQPHNFCCGYNSSMMYIQTNGDCYTCAEDFVTNKNLIGNISTEVDFPTFSINDTQCVNCEFLNICKGRCGRMHKEFSLSHINEYCLLNKFQFEYIKSRMDKINKYILDKELNININNSIFNYTEYTP